MQITPPDFLADPIAYLQFYWDQVSSYVILILGLILVTILYFIVTRIARRSLKSIGMGQEASTGIVLILRLIFFIAFVMIFVGFFEASYAAILSISAIFGTALGLAFSTALSNIVSGLYVYAARPFRVGDYVRIGAAEGIVREITLNYTRILLPDETRQLVPNSKVINSEVTNFRISLSEFVKDKEEEEAERIKSDHSYRDTLDNAWQQLRVLTRDEIAYRYTFDITIHMSKDHSRMLKHFDKVCEEWANTFLTRPSYFISGKPIAGVTYRFSFIVSDPMVIIRRNADFMKDLLSKYYSPSKSVLDLTS